METDNSYETAREVQMLRLVHVLEASHSDALLSFEFAEATCFIAGKHNLLSVTSIDQDLRLNGNCFWLRQT